jgi:metal-sulfur cluster biosynthetic enzyme
MSSSATSRRSSTGSFRRSAIRVDLVWEPAWTPDRMSERAKAFMGW